MAWLKPNKSISYLLLLCSVSLYLFFGYYTVRTDFYLVLTQYILLFALFIGLYKYEENNSNFLKLSAFILRITLLFSIPNLSNDFYRFIWDGRMIWEGLNPYLSLPENWIANNPDIIANSVELHKGMGQMNGSHYTCYPPINQLTFLIPAILFSKSVLGSTVVMRLLIILADFGIIYYGEKILALLKLPKNRIYLFALNPFIILELTGNLHFEGVMIFFLLGSFYYLFIKYWKTSAIFLALSICVKAIPLIFLPLIFRQLKLKAFVGYSLLTLGFTGLLFVPFVNQALVDNFSDSINLYFQNFEFNASIYYIIREIGYQNVRYNIIHSVGKVTPIVIFSAVIIISLIKQKDDKKALINKALIVITFYYLISTTVHPWYIAVPLILGIFNSKLTFHLAWSLLIILSYSAYKNIEYQENLYFVALEYILLFSFLGYDLYNYKKNRTQLLNTNS